MENNLPNLQVPDLGKQRTEKCDYYRIHIFLPMNRETILMLGTRRSGIFTCEIDEIDDLPESFTQYFRRIFILVYTGLDILSVVKYFPMMRDRCKRYHLFKKGFCCMHSEVIYYQKSFRQR